MSLDSLLEWIADHRLGMVFVAALIDATGLPFPGRIVLLLAGTVTADWGDLLPLVLTSTLGSLIGDHALYGAGWLGGERVLAAYCRVTLASESCIERTVRFFKRFGAFAVVVGRFSFGVRLFAAVMAGAGHLAYWRFLSLDAVGTVFYAALWLAAGHAVGAAVVERNVAARALLFVGPLAVLGLLAFRLVRRRRYGAAAHRGIDGDGRRA